LPTKKEFNDFRVKLAGARIIPKQMLINMG